MDFQFKARRRPAVTARQKPAVIIPSVFCSLEMDSSLRQITEIHPIRIHPKFYLLAFLLVFLAYSGVTMAAEDEFRERFIPLDHSYVVYQNNDDDQSSVEARISLKYVLYHCESWEEENIAGCRVTSNAKFHLYASYNGEFDYFLNTRTSGPVVNRLHNPAFHLKWELRRWPLSIDWVDIGFEHASNGQVVDANLKDEVVGSATNGEFLADLANKRGDNAYLDSISRSADYLSLSFGGQLSRFSKYSLSYKFYADDEESGVTWDGFAGKNVDFADYDVFGLKYALSLTGVDEIGIHLVLGSELFDTDSYDVYYIHTFKSMRGWDLPVMLTYHDGPMEHMSNYTKETQSLGLGFSFNY